MSILGENVLAALSAEELLLSFWKVVWGVLVTTLIWILPWALVCYAIHFAFSLPLRRRERARLFLDLLEMGIKRGDSVEHSIIAVSQSRDRMLGVRLHLLAAYLETELGLVRALEKVPHLLPPQLVAMLKVGAEIGHRQGAAGLPGVATGRHIASRQRAQISGRADAGLC